MNLVRKGRGFTLIEVLIAVAIVGLLTAIALPSYQEHINKGRRAEGKSALLKTIQLQERFYTANGTYTTDVGPLYGLTGATALSGENPSVEPGVGDGWYTLSANSTACGADGLQVCVTVVATPRNGFVDARCGVLSLNSRGVQGETGSETVQYCWR